MSVFYHRRERRRVELPSSVRLFAAVAIAVALGACSRTRL